MYVLITSDVSRSMCCGCHGCGCNECRLSCSVAGRLRPSCRGCRQSTREMCLSCGHAGPCRDPANPTVGRESMSRCACHVAMRVRAGTRPIQRWGGNRRVDVPVMWPCGSEQGPGQSNGGEGADERRAAEVLEQKPPKIDQCGRRLFDATEKR